MVTLLFLPNGGLASTISYSPCFPASASLVTTGRPVDSALVAAPDSAPDAVQQQVHRAEPRDAVHQLDAEERAALEPLLLRPVQLDNAWRGNHAPRAGNHPCRTPDRKSVWPGCGATTSTIAAMSGRGVKYWPAPPFTSSAFFCSNPS